MQFKTFEEHIYLFLQLIVKEIEKIKEWWRYLTCRHRGTFEYQPIYWSFHAGMPKYKTKT